MRSTLSVRAIKEAAETLVKEAIKKEIPVVEKVVATEAADAADAVDAVEAKKAPIELNPVGEKSVLHYFSQITRREFEELLNKSARPTLQRDDVLLKKFMELLKTYSNRDSYRTDFMGSSELLAQFPHILPTPKNQPYSDSELAIRARVHAKSMGSLGANVVGVYRPHEAINNPPSASKVSVAKLMAAGTHLGHSTKLWNSKTQPFIYGEYKGIHLIDAEKTLAYMRRAAKVAEGVAENGGIILFLGMKEGQLRAVREAARRCNGYYVTHKWVPGTITNSLQNPRARHEVDMAGIATGRQLNADDSTRVIKPDLIVMLSPLDNAVVIKEANQARIPTIGIVDTNCDPACVTYPIPANDDSTRATNLICGVLGRAAEQGFQRRLSKVNIYKTNLGIDLDKPLVSADGEGELDEGALDEEASGEQYGEEYGEGEMDEGEMYEEEAEGEAGGDVEQPTH